MKEDSVITALSDLGPDQLDRLRGQLAERADRDRLIDVAYRCIDSPVGPLLLAATDRGLVKVAFEQQDHDAVLHDLAHRISPRVLRLPKRLEWATRQLGEYFEQRRSLFELPLDRRLSHGFRLLVQEHLSDIPYGHTTTYGRLAHEVGHDRAARAVGTACATNPLPIVVPCHRVRPSSGGVGNYVGGPDLKVQLLELEGVCSG